MLPHQQHLIRSVPLMLRRIKTRTIPLANPRNPRPMVFHHRTTNRKLTIHSASLPSQQQTRSASPQTLRHRPRIHSRRNRCQQALPQGLPQGTHIQPTAPDNTRQSIVIAPRVWMGDSPCSRANLSCTRMVSPEFRNLMDHGGGSGFPMDRQGTQRTQSCLRRSMMTSLKLNGWLSRRQVRSRTA
jgi:hypothetical protein